ncbi:hypothetical protein E2542_SST01944 [Spatholobus suberectus]|nr:hypothetical protein E2542_SST01944 [Spatholobus suberectus]
MEKGKWWCCCGGRPWSLETKSERKEGKEGEKKREKGRERRKRKEKGKNGLWRQHMVVRGKKEKKGKGKGRIKEVEGFASKNCLRRQSTVVHDEVNFFFFSFRSILPHCSLFFLLLIIFLSFFFFLDCTFLGFGVSLRNVAMVASRSQNDGENCGTGAAIPSSHLFFVLFCSNPLLVCLVMILK